MAYSKKVIEKFENTLNEHEKNSVGRWNPSDSDIGTGMVGAPACGDVMMLQIKCKPENNSHVISDFKFKTYGCGSAIASSSLLTEWVKGRSLEEATEIRNKDIADELGLPPVKIHCSVLAEDAIQAAIADVKQKNKGSDEAE